MQKIIAIIGPTASGKSALGVYLAKKIDGEIISADSRQVYRNLDIATGKITKKEMQGVPHHLLDVASPRRQFSVSDFVTKGEKAIQDISKHTHVPILVGGTGLYINALLGKVQIPEVPPNPILRKKLEEKTTTQLFAMLQKKDPERARTIEPHNKRRLIRALEIAAALGKNPPPSSHTPYDVLWLGLNPNDSVLHKRIQLRIKDRMKRGMLAEAKRLHAQGLSFRRMDELGLEYRLLAQVLQGTMGKEEFIHKLQSATWKYTKRQLRWYKNNSHIVWITNQRTALHHAQLFLHKSP